MSNVALVTGATGLLGRQVVQAFERAEWKIVGTGFTRAKPPSILKVDLCSEAEISKALYEVKYGHSYMNMFCRSELTSTWS